MSYSIDLSKHSTVPMEVAQRGLLSFDPTDLRGYVSKRRDVFQTTALLDDITSPASVTWSRGTFVYRGRKIRPWGVFDMYSKTLELLWNEFPNDREKMASAMRTNGMSHVPCLQGVARGFAASTRQSYELPDGWLVASGIGIERARKLLYAAAFSVGLVPGVDLIVCTRSGKLETGTLRNEESQEVITLN